nr:IPT/TIG domain-containing protein [uncultured Flavobacterium sp.]
MKNINRSIAITFILLTFILNACSSSEDPKYIPPTLVSFPVNGLLGQPIKIQIENFEVDKLQVFFDLEKAQINYVSDKEIAVIVPRTIKTNNPTLKIIDLNENKTILEQAFSLKKPTISKYSSDSVTFDETFTIYGENFDMLKDFVSVTVNNEIATIISVDYNKIELKIPSKIKTANLEIKVRSQLQEVTSTLPLNLKSPTIFGINNSTVWIGTLLYVFGENFNPNQDLGEVFVNGVQSRFNATNNKLSIETPPGPYKDFKITNITYKTAGLTYSFDCSLNIMNDGILVDYITDGQFQHPVFVYNNKAYQFKYYDNGSHDFNYTYSLLEFSPTTEKWTELSSFKYKGYLEQAVFDGKRYVYLYKGSPTTNEHSLSKLDLSTFIETPILLPFGNNIFNSIIFAYQNNLYFLSGIVSKNGTNTVLDQKYQYSEASDSWSVLSSSAFSAIPPLGSQGNSDYSYLFIGNDIYITTFTGNYIVYKITPNLTTTKYGSYTILFEYSNAVFGGNYNSNLFNINTSASKKIDLYNLFGYYSIFFTINNEIYYSKSQYGGSYYPNSIITNKLRKEILNGLY